MLVKDTTRHQIAPGKLLVWLPKNMVAANLIFSKQMRQESILICLEKAAIATRLAPIVKFTLQQSPQTSWLAARIQYVEARNIWGYPTTLPLHGILSLDHAQICVSSFTPCILGVTKNMMEIYLVSQLKKNLTMLLSASKNFKMLEILNTLVKDTTLHRIALGKLLVWLPKNMVAVSPIFSKQTRQENILICLGRVDIATRLAPIVKFMLQQSPQTSWLAAQIQYVEARNI